MSMGFIKYCCVNRLHVAHFMESSSHGIFALLGCYAVYIGLYLPMFRDNLWFPSSRVEQSSYTSAGISPLLKFIYGLPVYGTPYVIILTSSSFFWSVSCARRERQRHKLYNTIEKWTPNPRLLK